MTFGQRPLWNVCTANDDVLTEGTASDFEFDYVDISSVTTGHISSELQTLAFGEAPSRARRLAKPGDVIVSTVRTYLKAIAPVTEQDRTRVYSTGFAVLRPNVELMDWRFFKYALLAEGFIDQITAHSEGVSYPAINASDLIRLSVPSPELTDQHRIADFLDLETAEIDAMNAELDRLMATLGERRRAATQAALVDGFKDAVLKPLWSLLAPVKDQGHPTEDVLSVYRDHGVILKDSRDDNFNRTPENLSSYQLVQPGDVVINKMKAWQGSVGVSSYRGIISPDYQVCRPIGTEMEPQYLHLVLRSPQMIPQYGVRSKGIRPAQWRLYWEDMAPLLIPVPPRHEQRRVAAELDEQTARIDDMIADANQLKTLLAERRSTLITEVVTGVKEVPE